MENNTNLLSALKSIDVASLSRADWIAVGMALKEEGLPCSIWDDWSRNDSRYKPGECEQKWAGFHGTDKPVKGGTIVQMAKDRGWKPFVGEDGVMSWDDTIEYDGAEGFTGFAAPDAWSPTKDLITYLELLFKPGERVGYVTNDVWQDKDGRWLPSKGVYDRTAGELIESLKKHPDDLGATVGDWKEEAGAWIRFNPVDGDGVKNENVTRFTYALVESDTLPIAEQDILFRKLELPIAALVHSGGKSLHAIVHVDAENYEEYRKRVEFLYDFLEKNGVSIDKQNRNPSRLSRMPGVTRNGNRQYLAATNIGRKSWTDWMDYVEGVTDELPGMVSLSEYKDNPPELPEELIKGILRRGHKMLVSGSSKAGKSFLLMELCIAIAEGRKWLGFECRKGRVLYVNLEIDPASAIVRFLKIYDALGLPKDHTDDIVIWNLRGHAVPLDQLVPKLIRRVKDQHFDAIIIDPIYKVITGDENNASEMGAFCNQFDKICTETGCSTIYCHHHSKGAQGMKKAMDRASGSGVFARDPDAQLDMIQLELSDELKNNVADTGATAWRLESSLREFANIAPINFWFEYPIHRLDTTGELARLGAEGSPIANLTKSGNYSTPESRRTAIDNAYDALSIDENVQITVNDIAEYCGYSYMHEHRTKNGNYQEFWVCGSYKKRKKGNGCPVGGTINHKNLKKVCAEVLDLPKFNEKVFLEKVDHIDVPKRYVLTFYLKDGTVVTKPCLNTGHQDCWTAEYRAETSRKRRNSPRAKGVTALSGRIKCSACGCNFRRCTQPACNPAKPKMHYWRCAEHSNGCITVGLREDVLKPLIAEMMELPEYDEEQFKNQMEAIYVKDKDLLEFHFKDGRIKTTHYVPPEKTFTPRSEEARDHMRQLMKERWTPDLKAEMGKKMKKIRSEKFWSSKRK